MRRWILKALRGYKRWISPMLPAGCKYVPTCSEYAVQAVERFGIVRGGWMATWRVLRCNPFSKGGVDPVLYPAAKAAHPHCGADGRCEHLPRPV